LGVGPTSQAIPGPGTRQGLRGIGEALLEGAHEMVVDAAVGLEAGLVPEEVGAAHAPHWVLAAVAVHVSPDAHVRGVAPVQEHDAVGPLD